MGATVRVKRSYWLGLTGLLVSVALWAYCRARPGMFNESFWEHAHCIVQAGGTLQNYAEAHAGRFPHDVRGYGHALLLLPADSPWYALTGPGYDGQVLARAKRGEHGISEAECGRVYVQGLRLDSNPEVALLFDNVPTPGGDHCHFLGRLWAPYGREVLLVDGSHGFIPEAEWPAFARRQVELLVAEGFAHAEAERLYGLSRS